VTKKSPRGWSRRRRVLTTLGIGVGVLALIAAGGVIGVKRWFAAEFPRLEGTPEVGTWYGVYPDGAIDAVGDPYHGIIRMGSADKVMVVFNGGGVSVDDYTEARPATGDGEGFYSITSGLDNAAKLGLGDGKDANAFRDWTVIQLPYSTGDFHVGAGENEVTGTDGQPQTVHHAGITNFDLVMDEVKQFLGDPTDLIVAGSSAGGFGAAGMTDHVMSVFPDTRNVTTIVDSSLLLYDWHQVSIDVWKSPAEISDDLTTNNFTLDTLTALKAKHPTVTILFASSIRDSSLTQMQAYLNGDTFEATREGGQQYLRDLTVMVDQLQEQVPDVGIYLFEGQTDDETRLTQHTVLRTGLYTEFVDETTPMAWISDAVGGNVESYGLQLLPR